MNINTGIKRSETNQTNLQESNPSYVHNISAKEQQKKNTQTHIPTLPTCDLLMESVTKHV